MTRTETGMRTTGLFKPDPDEPMYLGRKASDEPYFFFHGKIDDLRVYNRALSVEEIEAMFLEQGWEPIEELNLPVVEEKDMPTLECDHVQMLVHKEHITAAAGWYIKYLSFKALMEHKDSFYMLSLYKGPALLLHGVTGTPPPEGITPFVFKTRRSIDDVKEQLVSAGASILEVRNEVFATFLTFTDPFGYKWIVIRER